MREQDLGLVLSAFQDATNCAAAVWIQPDSSRPLVRLASAPLESAPPASRYLPLGPDTVRIETPGGASLAVRVHAVRRAWLVVMPV